MLHSHTVSKSSVDPSIHTKPISDQILLMNANQAEKINKCTHFQFRRYMIKTTVALSAKASLNVFIRGITTSYQKRELHCKTKTPIRSRA